MMEANSESRRKPIPGRAFGRPVSGHVRALLKEATKLSNTGHESAVTNQSHQPAVEKSNEMVDVGNRLVNAVRNGLIDVLTTLNSSGPA